MTITPSTFRAYDIRGIVGETVDHTTAHLIGHAYADLLPTKDKPVFVCRDGRLSSPELAHHLIQGLLAGGCDVVDLGVGPTPMLYFAVYTQSSAGGIMVTGSHNPPTHNGFKIMRGTSALYGEDIQAILARCQTLNTLPLVTPTKSARHARLVDYVPYLRASVLPQRRPLTIAWDPGNGAAGDVITELTASLPGTHHVINATIDGHFPAHHPDPAKEENLAQLRQLVLDKKCDIGFAFDGDGDRVGVIDDQGNTLMGDQILIMLARLMLKQKPGAIIMADVKTSQCFFDEVARLGGKPLMWKTGHSLIKAKMKEVGAALGGEMSGHIFFKEGYYGFDDGIFAALRFLDILAESDKPLSEITHDLPRLISTPEIHTDCPDDQKFNIVEQVKQKLKRDGHDFNDIDGIRFSNDQGWWLLRASNTQAALITRIEAKTEAGLVELRGMLEGYLL